MRTDINKKMLTFRQKNVSIIHHFGEGSQGSTYLVIHKGIKYVMKLYMAAIEEPSHFTRISMRHRIEDSKRFAIREQKILTLLNCSEHVLCMKAKGIWIPKGLENQAINFPTVFEEYKEGYTDLYELSQENVIHQDDVRVIAHDLIETVRFMHKKGIAHQDIKLANIIYNCKTKDMILIDVGGACLEKERYCDLLSTYVPEEADYLEEKGVIVDRELKNRFITQNDRNKYETIKKFDFYAIAVALDQLNHQIQDPITRKIIYILFDTYYYKDDVDIFSNPLALG